MASISVDVDIEVKCNECNSDLDFSERNGELSVDLCSKCLSVKRDEHDNIVEELKAEIAELKSEVTELTNIGIEATGSKSDLDNVISITKI